LHARPKVPPGNTLRRGVAERLPGSRLGKTRRPSRSVQLEARTQAAAWPQGDGSISNPPANYAGRSANVLHTWCRHTAETAKKPPRRLRLDRRLRETLSQPRQSYGARILPVSGAEPLQTSRFGTRERGPIVPTPRTRSSAVRLSTQSGTGDRRPPCQGPLTWISPG
jgi:hypothetical protein